ncbi:RDD family protein [Dactylosporangium sp. CA-139066]|uniref:RDD family protein n=1 Tax=Dactylosporangium sp. CA-139066 TaxID=3239930 RepID=UPI003D8A3C1C
MVPYAPNGMPLAGFGDRFLAYLIDGLVTFGVAVVLAIPIFIAMFAVIAGTANTDSSSAGPSILLILLFEFGYVLAILAWIYIYHVEMFGHSGVTWGKRAMKLRIIRLDDPAAPPTRGVMARRWAVQNVAGAVVPFFSYVDGLWQLWDKPYQQCLHDKAAGTIVVKAG